MKLSATSDEILQLCAAFEANRNLATSGWRHHIIAADRRKYISIDEVDEGDEPPYVHRGGVFLIDRETGVVYSIKGYGQRGWRVGTIEGLTEQYKAGSATFRPESKHFHVEGKHSRVASWPGLVPLYEWVE